MFTAQQFRTDKVVRHAVLDTMTHGDWQLSKIFEWGIYRYLQLQEIRPRIGPQTLTVIDVTDSVDDLARFRGRYHDCDPDENAGNYALVAPPDEGVYALVMHSDNHKSQYYLADLPIYIGTGADIDFSNRYGSMVWAVEQYREYFGDRESPNEKIANTLRAAARREHAIPGAWQGTSRQWYFPKHDLLTYLEKSLRETRGRPRNPVSDLIENFDGDVSRLQHTLAQLARDATGNIPRGQLWQPCEYPGCDDEPVCMNCMMCEQTHCRCFE